MKDQKEQKQIEFDIVVLDETGKLAKDLVALFSKGKQNTTQRAFHRVIPIEKDNGKLILNLKNKNAFDLKIPDEQSDYYFCDGTILCVDLGRYKSTSQIQDQLKIIKEHNGSEIAVTVVTYCQNKEDISVSLNEIKSFCDSSTYKLINIDSDTKLDISKIFIEVFTSSKIFTQVENGDYSKKKQKKKGQPDKANEKKFDLKRLVSRIITTFIFYTIAYYFFPHILGQKSEGENK